MKNINAVETGNRWISYEKLYPLAIAFCTIMMAIWIPITIANSYIIHDAGTHASLLIFNFGFLHLENYAC